MDISTLIKILKENIIGIIISIILAMACFVVLGVEYFVFMNPTTSAMVFITPTAIDTSVVNYDDSSNTTITADDLKNGTLQNSTLGEWRRATKANRLATSLDFILITQNVDKQDTWKLATMIADVEACISAAAKGGDMDDTKTSFAASFCMAGLFPSNK